MFDPQAGTSTQSESAVAMRKYLAYSSFGAFLIGSLSYKMIGVETIHVFQEIAIMQIFSSRFHTYFHHFSALLIPIGRSSFIDTSANLTHIPDLALLEYTDSLEADYFLVGLAIIACSLVFLVLFSWERKRSG